MSIISIPNTFSPGGVIYSSQVNSNFSVIYNDYNGNVGNSNLSSSLVITDNKLSQIVSASKVNATSLTNLSGTPSGAGVLPATNLPVGTAAGNIPQLNGSGQFATAIAPFSTQNVVTGSRTVGVVYQNTTGKTMFVVATTTGSGTTSAYTDSSSNPTTVVATFNTTTTAIYPFMVLNNNYYKLVTTGGDTTLYWVEWY